MFKKNRAAQIQLLKNKRFLAEKCIVAESFVSRLKGLMGSSHLPSGSGVFFPRCNSVHMWFMRIPLDIVFLKFARDEGPTRLYEVLAVFPSVQPWKLLPATCWSATDTLELPVGTLQGCEVEVGDTLCLS